MESDHDALQRSAHEHLLLHFARNGAYGPGGSELVVLERGEGPYVYDTLGRRHIDGLSSLFCSQIGYGYGKEMGEAAGAQLGRLGFATNWGVAHPPAIELAGELVERAPEGIEKVFFTSGGSESVEAAWKIVRQYHVARGEPQRTKAIARHIAYHGVTLGALSFTGVQPYKEPFGTPPVHTVHVSNTNRFRAPDGHDEAAFCARLLAEIERTIEAEGPESIAMMIMEPIQNAGGGLTPPEGYWPGLRSICDRHGILLVADEVISGFGRLGEWFACTRYGGRPDLITVAKGLTSAYAPMGAVLATERVAAPLYERGRPLLHGITFGGHPVSAAIALKNIEIFERDGVLENVRALQGHFESRLRELLGLPIVGDVRGDGFYWAIELVRDDHDTRWDAEERERLLRGFIPGRLIEARLIARADDRGDSVLVLAPPLISDRALLDDIVEAVHGVLADAGEFMGIAHVQPAGVASG
jgi:adenosylmethionine-8-amino-7-oxononanoate aminotransferase